MGEEVLARNMATGKLEYRKVVALTRPHQDHLLELKIEGEHAAIEATPSHPFWVKRAGHAATWIPAGKMHAGDQVLTEKGIWEKVTEDVPLNRLATVYNFEVQDDHDYFVGASGILVHNLGSCDFLVTPNGDVIPVPEGATGPNPVDNGKGIQFNGGSGGNGLDPSVNNVRVMDPNAQNPTGYVNYGKTLPNGSWQSVNPYTGQSLSRSDPWWHFPL